MAVAPFPEIEFLRQRAYTRCEGLSLRLDELVNDFPGGTPKDFIAALQVVLSELKRLIDATRDPGVLSWVCLLVEQDLSEYLKWLDNAHTAQTPRGLVKVLEKAADKLAPKRAAKLLVAPDYECNYSIDDQIPRLTNLLVSFLPKRAMRRIFRSLPKALYLVQFPRIDRDHVLNYAIFGHELGHPIVQKVLNAYEQTAEYKRQVKQVQADLRRMSRRRGTVSRYRARQAEQDFKTVSKIVRRGLEELLSDSAGVFTFGASALFAAVDHFFSTRLDNAPTPEEYYPPTRYRHRLMLQLLRQEGHLSAIELISRRSSLKNIRDGIPSAVSYIEQLVSRRQDMRVLQDEELVGAAYGWVERALPTLLKRVRRECQSFLYARETVEEEVPELLERLGIQLPPSEKGIWPLTRPPDWRSSLLAGWLTRLADHGNTASLSSSTSTARQIAKLTTKGIEDAVLGMEYLKRYPLAR